jgi:LacI family transcriptional regulator|tara:strand:+ start:4134 stop:5204 length:1071 start_codon:yes stop_codon:yes gene_type:complete
MNKTSTSQASIAKHLGVSQALVSMVLNGREEGISPATFKRIWEYAVASGYTPKGMKVSLAKTEQPKATGVGYFLRAPFRLATKTNFFSHVSQGLHDYVSECGLNLIFLGSEADDLSKMKKRLGVVRRTLKGVVVLGEVGSEFQSFVRDLNLPTVIVSSRATGVFHSINSNELKAADMLAEHLYELGHRKFCFIGGTAPMGRYLERKEAVMSSLARLGVKDADSHFVRIDGGADRTEGQQAAQQVLDEFSSKTIPTAWIVSNGSMARGVCTRLLHEGLVIGKDVSIAAIDMTRVCWDEEPSLTSAAAVPEEMGFEAGRLVVESEIGASDTFRDIVLPANIEVRESTGKPSKARLLSS